MSRKITFFSDVRDYVECDNCNEESERELADKYFTKVFDHEYYYFVKKPQNYGVLSFDDSRYVDENADVIENINHQHLLTALRLAIEDLSPIEQKIIDECFFSSKKRTFSELAEEHSLNRFAYKRVLQKILKKLKKSIVNMYEEF